VERKREQEAERGSPAVRRRLGLIVDGEWYANSAAKFWPWFLDETLRAWPEASAAELSTLSGALLDHRLLFPQCALQAELEQILRGESSLNWNETLAELELVGEPCPVRVCVHGDGGHSVLSDGVSDVVDSETLPYLVVWLLQWSSIPPDQWNRPLVNGSFTGHDPFRELAYTFRFSLSSCHLSEGLYRRTVMLDHTAGAD